MIKVYNTPYSTSLHQSTLTKTGLITNSIIPNRRDKFLQFVY